MIPLFRDFFFLFCVRCILLKELGILRVEFNIGVSELCKLM